MSSDPLHDPYLDHVKAVPSNRLPPEERYRRDAHFRQLVDVIEMFIRQCDYTPTEVREAAMLAAIRHEMRTVRPLRMGRDGSLSWATPHNPEVP